jgi:hypothetical protein
MCDLQSLLECCSDLERFLVAVEPHDQSHQVFSFCIFAEALIRLLEAMKACQAATKLFVIHNVGYVSKRNTQFDFGDGHYLGADAVSSDYIPPIDALARSFRLPYIRCDPQDDVEAIVHETLAMKGPFRG